jgi:hypothetical protein
MNNVNGMVDGGCTKRVLHEVWEQTTRGLGHLDGSRESLKMGHVVSNSPDGMCEGSILIQDGPSLTIRT